MKERETMPVAKGICLELVQNDGNNKSFNLLHAEVPYISDTTCHWTFFPVLPVLATFWNTKTLIFSIFQLQYLLNHTSLDVGYPVTPCLWGRVDRYVSVVFSVKVECLYFAIIYLIFLSKFANFLPLSYTHIISWMLLSVNPYKMWFLVEQKVLL